MLDGMIKAIQHLLIPNFKILGQEGDCGTYHEDIERAAVEGQCCNRFNRMMIRVVFSNCQYIAPKKKLPINLLLQGTDRHREAKCLGRVLSICNMYRRTNSLILAQLQHASLEIPFSFFSLSGESI
jgi:hypothetical protein